MAPSLPGSSMPGMGLGLRSFLIMILYGFPQTSLSTVAIKSDQHLSLADLIAVARDRRSSFQRSSDARLPSSPSLFRVLWWILLALLHSPLIRPISRLHQCTGCFPVKVLVFFKHLSAACVIQVTKVLASSSADWSWSCGGRWVRAKEAVNNSGLSDRVDHPDGFRSISSRRGSVDLSVKLMNLWRLSDSLSRTFQSATRPLIVLETRVTSMCDSDWPRTNVGESPLLHACKSKADIMSARMTPLLSSIGLPQSLDLALKSPATTQGRTSDDLPGIQMTQLNSDEITGL
ncbi:unnamed protein product [Macrosiphum euphorbiae]|uniref:Uncharacterized protein n=2 Tax=Macrosiphum euphorbiae TaxID=13131 RepID=A0AAV0WKU1_9HEMI|nr:unnamed protein product [Macrosiphum euphorbiae]